MSDDRLKLLIERIERLSEEGKGIRDDIKDVFSEAKSTGYDPKVMRLVIKLRALSKDDRDNADAVLDTYRNELGIA